MQDLEALRRRAARTFGTLAPDAAMKRVRAIVGTDNLPSTAEGELAKSALDKLKNAGGRPTPRELAALELMMRMMRPAPKVLAAGVEMLTEPEFQDAFPNWSSFQALLGPLEASIGRIDMAGANSGEGTGFLIADDVIVTNRHVLDKISRGTRELEAGQAVIGFRWFAEGVAEPPIAITGVVAWDERFDIALLRVEKQPLRRKLSIAAAAPQVEQLVAAVGHPYDDPVNNPIFTRQIFGNRWGVKRVAPGEIVALTGQGTIAGHDCSTLGGNSGSPLLSLDTAEVVGLHMNGSFLWRNEAVAAPVLAEFASKHG